MGSYSVKKLMDIVDTVIPVPPNKSHLPFLMPVESVYVIKGRGFVIAGKIERGKIFIGDDVYILGKKIVQTVCMGLEMFNKVLDYAVAGENVGILIKGLGKKEGKGRLGYKEILRRGTVILTSFSDEILICKSFEAKVYILSFNEGGRKQPIKSSYKPQFFFRTANITGAILLDDTNEFVLPGTTVKFRVNLESLCPLNVGLRFAIREGHKTIGAGTILKLLDSNIK